MPRLPQYDASKAAGDDGEIREILNQRAAPGGGAAIGYDNRMANRHFGNLGDIWKHLPLGDVLRTVRPDRYWESHAGAASYPLTHSANRDFGVYHFLAHASAEPALGQSAHIRLLRELAGEDRVPAVYPGSAFVAMWALLDRPVRHLYCDIDGESLSTIAATAEELGLTAEAVECVEADGVGTVTSRIQTLADDEAAGGTFLLIDPFHITAANDDGVNSLDLFAAAAGKGVKTILWYCARTIDEWERLRSDVSTALDKSGIDESGLWRGEVELLSMSERGFESPGVGMCGLLCANLPDEVIETAKRQGEALAAIYEDATLPCGLSGALAFHESCACRT
ncbi:MAG: hypothetical protein JSV91_00725 [Phycisphaerales bacterium]|nr:MAG: hypothetical protein JSV91_00725 [Phycisphaerales bacterium]